jgi:hypothetical protein
VENKKTIFWTFALVLFFIVIAHFWGSSRSWYFTKWWFDVVLHFLGGFWLFTTFLHISNRIKTDTLRKQSSLNVFLYGMVFVITIGVLWEVFEYVLGVAMTKGNYLFDTLSDLANDVLGGALAALFFIRKDKTK